MGTVALRLLAPLRVQDSRGGLADLSRAVVMAVVMADYALAIALEDFRASEPRKTPRQRRNLTTTPTLTWRDDVILGGGGTSRSGCASFIYRTKVTPLPPSQLLI